MIETINCRECGNNINFFEDYKSTSGKTLFTTLFGFDIPKYMKFDGVNKTFELGLCEDCCRKHFEKKWKGKVGNQGYKRFFCPNSMSKAAYNVPDEDYTILKQKSKEKHGVTLENLTRKWGEEIGKQKWEHYCKKQAETNTFEYKKEKYGWTKEQFDEYNASRAVTKENLIKRWGEEEGIKTWNKYVDRQIQTKSKDYVIDKYGEDYWIELCKKKTLTLENFIRKWGKVEGSKRYDEYYEKTKGGLGCSNVSKQCFDDIIDILNWKYSKEFGNFDKENVLYYDKEISKYCNGKNFRLDCYFKDFNVNVEFNGDIFHGNPKLYNENDRCNPFRIDLTAKDMWEKDKNRLNLLKSAHNIDTLVIWEYDYYKNFEWKLEDWVEEILAPLLRKNKNNGI